MSERVNDDIGVKISYLALASSRSNLYPLISTLKLRKKVSISPAVLGADASSAGRCLTLRNALCAKLRRICWWRGRNPAGSLLRFSFPFLPGRLFYLLAFLRGHFFKGTIFFTGSFALFGLEFAPYRQAVMVALFLFGCHARIVFGSFEQAASLFPRQGIPLLFQRGKSFPLRGSKRTPRRCCRAGGRADKAQQ